MARISRTLGLFMLFAVTLLCGPKARASATYIQSCKATGDTTNGPATATCAITVTAGHLLVYVDYSCGPTPGFTESLGNTFVQSTAILGFVNGCSFRNRAATIQYACTSTGGVDTVSYAVNGVTPRVGFIFAEYSSVICPSPEDPTNGTGVLNATTSGGAGSINSGNKTTTFAGDLLIALGCTRGGTTLTAGAGYTIRNSVIVDDGSASTMTVYLEDQISGVAGAYQGVFTQSGPEIYVVALGAFGSSGAGGGAAKRKHPPQIVRWLRATRPGGKWNA